MKKLIFIVIIFSLMIWLCNDWRPSPKTGEIVYDIPALLWKNIDEVVAVTADTSFKKKDSLARKEQLRKREYYKKHPEHTSRNPYDTLTLSDDDRGYFKHTKQGWTLGVWYELRSRKVNNVSLYTDYDSFSTRIFQYTELDKLLLIGNLNISDTTKYVVWFDGGNGLGSVHYTYTDPMLRDKDFSSIKIYRPGEYPHDR